MKFLVQNFEEMLLKYQNLLRVQTKFKRAGKIKNLGQFFDWAFEEGFFSRSQQVRQSVFKLVKVLIQKTTHSNQ